MADTVRGFWPKETCSDCGEVEQVCIRHWGPLVPPGQVGKFDETCWEARLNDRDAGLPPRPLGTNVRVRRKLD